MLLLSGPLARLQITLRYCDVDIVPQVERTMTGEAALRPPSPTP